MKSKGTMVTAFAYCGSKKSILKALYDLVPKEKFSKVVEPFCGGAAFTLNFDKSQAGDFICADLNEDLIDAFTQLTTLPTPTSESLDKWDTKDVQTWRSFYFDKTKTSNLDRLIKFVMRGAGSFASCYLDTGAFPYKTINIKNALEKIFKQRDAYKSVKFCVSDFANTIDEHDESDAFFFIDPPYGSGMHGYLNGGKWSEMNGKFEELLGILHIIRGKFMMTIDDSQYMRSLFSDFHQRPLEVPSRQGHKVRHELVITNFPTSPDPSCLPLPHFM